MIGYKGFNSDLTCLGYSYEVGKTHVYEDEIELCQRGFHFCQYPIDVLYYYDLSDTIYAKVYAEGKVITKDRKSVTDKLTILHLVSRDDLFRQMPEHIVLEDGTKIWYQNGLLHRDNGPAVEYPDGMKRWYRHNLLHRDDGPALEFSNGEKKWFQHGLLHRVDGPAIEWPNGFKEWWHNGVFIKSETTEGTYRHLGAS